MFLLNIHTHIQCQLVPINTLPYLNNDDQLRLFSIHECMERIRARLFSIHSCMENKLTHVIMIESIIQSVPFLKWLWFVYDWIGTKFGGCNWTLIDYPALALATTWQLSSPYLNTTNWSRRPTELSKAMTRPFSSKKPIAVAVFVSAVNRNTSSK